MIKSFFRRALIVTGLAAFAPIAKAVGYLTLRGNDHVHVLEFEFKDGAVIRIASEDGAQSSITLNGLKVRFILKAKTAKGGDLQDVEVMAVEDAKFSRGAIEVDGLRAGTPFSPTGAGVPESFSKLGIRSAKYVRSYSGDTFRSLKNKRAVLVGLHDGGHMTKTGGEEDPENQKCCTFSACGGASGSFCTTGKSGCGGDSCGSCCV